jgi:hypothetical protein
MESEVLSSRSDLYGLCTGKKFMKFMKYMYSVNKIVI